jgi:uncharacterized protein involved in exopolysaccharide biosynthesis
MDQMDYEIDLIECLQVLGRRKWLILAIIMASVLSAYIVSSTMTKFYSASCVIMIRPNPLEGLISLQEGAAGTPQASIKDYVEILTARALVEEALAKLGWLSSDTPEEIDSWHKVLSASQISGTNMVKVSVENSNPDRVADFLNALVEACRDKKQEINLQSIGRAKTHVEEQLAFAEQRLKEDEEALLKYKQANAITDLSVEAIADSARVVILDKLLSEASARLQSAKAKGNPEVAALKAEQAALDTALRQAKAELAAIPKKEVETARLERNRQTSEAVYTMLRTRYEELQISEAIQGSEIFTIDAAIVPDKPIKPRKLLNTAIAGILGLFVGVGLAFVLEHTDKLK